MTVDDLKQTYEYDPETGAFTHLKSYSHRKVGDVAGYRAADGYLKIRFKGRVYPAHRLAWLYVHGGWPEHALDHKNGDRSDNRIANLREASRTQNAANCKRPSSNTSGHKGVFALGSRWFARIMVNGRSVALGGYESKDLAAAAYAKAASKYFGEFGRPA